MLCFYYNNACCCICRRQRLVPDVQPLACERRAHPVRGCGWCYRLHFFARAFFDFAALAIYQPGWFRALILQICVAFFPHGALAVIRRGRRFGEVLPFRANFNISAPTVGRARFFLSFLLVDPVRSSIEMTVRVPNVCRGTPEHEPEARNCRILFTCCSHVHLNEH